MWDYYRDVYKWNYKERTSSKTYIKRIFNLNRWTKMKRGGHFAALEQPNLLVKDIRVLMAEYKQKENQNE